MKKMTIIPCDGMVVVDGDGIAIDVDCDPDIHAIQWDGEKQTGEIEYKDESRKGNVKIGPGEIASFLPLVDAHGKRRKEIDQKVIDDLAQVKIDHPDLDVIFPPHLATTKRYWAMMKELTVYDQLDEILKFIDNTLGDKTPEMQALIDKHKEIKDRFPKEGE